MTHPAVVPPSLHSARWGLLIVLLSLTAGLYAQRPPTSVTGSGGTPPPGTTNPNQRQTTAQRLTAADTFGIFIFQVDNPNEERAFADSLLDAFQQYDPTRQAPDDYAHLGVVGSAHRPLVYTGRDRSGYDLGWHHYDLYYANGHTLPYYRLARPYTHVWYMQGGEQRDNIIKADFSRNFAKGLSYTLDYQAITQEGESTHYPNQRNQSRALATGLWLHSPKGKYDGFLSYAANTTNTEDNGGILALPESGGEFSSPATAAVLLADGRSRHALREVMYTHYYRLGGQVDSTGRARRAFTLSHQFDYDKNTYRYNDAFAFADTTFYQRFPALLLDARGARYYIDQRTVENSFRLSTFRLASGNFGQQRQQRDLIEVGFTHRYNRISQEPIAFTVNNLMLTAKVGLRLGERVRLQADGWLDLLDQAGDFRINGRLDVDLRKAGLLALDMRNQLYSPTGVQQQFYLTQLELYRNNFGKTIENTVGAAYTLPKTGIALGGRYHLLNNYIYYDITALPRQADDAIGILQLTAQKDFRLGAFRLLNRVVWQRADDAYLRLPTLVGKHSLVYDGVWFRNLTVQLGADVRYTSAFRADYFNPMVAQFQLQNQQEVAFYPNVDAYFSMRVDRFRAFIKGENLTTLLEPDERLFQSAFYPWPSAAVRWGVSWRMLD